MSGPNRHAERLAEWTERGRVGTPPQPAATVVLVRDRESELETLVLRKNSKIAFGGMWVFPGGRVDDEDRRPGQGDELAIARRAAVREALEETGLALGEESLVPFSHWTPPPITPRRYLTWFFVARTPERFATVIARVDGGVVALWHGDEGYEDGVPDRPGARHRLWMLERGWRYERRGSGGTR